MELKFRKAKREDVELYYNWFNDTLVSWNLLNQEVIEYKDYILWFENCLNDPASFLYLFMDQAGVPAGQVRIKKGSKKEALIDISVDKFYKETLLSSLMLQKATEDFFISNNEVTIYANINKANFSAYKSFLKAGFKDISIENETEVYKLLKKNIFRELVCTIENEGDLYEVVKINNDNDWDTLTYFDLFYTCFGKRPHLDRAWFEWYYKANPDGQCSNYILINKKNGNFIASYSFSPTFLQNNTMSLKVGVGVNGMVHPDYRNKGLYAKLIKAATDHDDSDLYFAYPNGFNKGSIAGHKKAGWVLLKKIYFYSIRQIRDQDTDPLISELKTFKDIHNFNSFIERKEQTNYFKKSAEWMNWRFFLRPGREYKVFGLFDTQNAIIGYMVLSYYKSEKNIRCQVIDYKTEDNNGLTLLLKRAEKEAFNNQCNVLDIWLDEQSNLLDYFSSKSFLQDEEFYEMLCYNKKEINLNFQIKSVLSDLDAV